MSNVRTILIPHGHISNVLPSILGYLKKSETWSGGRSSTDDILAFLFSGQMRLWLVADISDDHVMGYVITEEKEYPRCKMLVCQYCAGDEHIMEQVRDVTIETLERYARDAGCAGIEFFGRPGWGAYIKDLGYEAKIIVYEKFFGE